MFTGKSNVINEWYLYNKLLAYKYKKLYWLNDLTIAFITFGETQHERTTHLIVTFRPYILSLLSKIRLSYILER